MGALAVVLILAALLGGGTNGPVYDGDSSAGDGSDDASSITDIYADHHTTIPKVDGYDPTLRMAVLDTFGDELIADADGNIVGAVLVGKDGSVTRGDGGGRSGG